MHKQFSASVLVLGTLTLASGARAYCRTQTCQLRNDIACLQDSQTGCFKGGVPVYWTNSCIAYAIQRDGSRARGIDADAVSKVVATGFRTWSGVTCAGGDTPPLVGLSQGEIACDAVEYNRSQPDANVNLILFEDDFEDTPSFGVGTIALTTITADINTGAIFDADIELNSRDEDFVIGPINGPTTDDVRDLQGVLNHEIGHFLGLGHSYEPDSLMYAGYEARVMPAADDVEGICATLGEAAADPSCSVEQLGTDTGCLGTADNCSGSGCVDSKGSNVVVTESTSQSCSFRIERATVWPALGWATLIAFGAHRRRSRAIERSHSKRGLAGIRRPTR